jgi:hypothetical protein
LVYIKSNFGAISIIISRLQADGAEMHVTLVLVKSTECEVQHTRGKVADSVKSKLQKAQDRNYGYVTLCKINDTLKCKWRTLEEHEQVLNSSDLTLLKNVPLTSCNVERSLSCCKTILNENLKSLLFDLKIHTVIHCNADKH